MPATKQQTVVMYPFPVVGHVVPMVQLAKVFLRHGYDVTIVLVEPPSGLPGFGADVINRIAASNPCISFHLLPQIPDPVRSSGKPLHFLVLELLHQYNDALEAFLRSIPRLRLHSLVTGMFTAHAVDVAAKLRVPVYAFFASAAAIQVPPLLVGRQTGLKELGEACLEFLGVPPFPASNLTESFLLHPEDDLCRTMTDVFKRCTDTDGVLINTFESLESRAVQALRDPQCVPGRVLRPIYCVGPLVGVADQGSAERHECLTWLDVQPESSVVFICFGSRGVLSAEQLREIAVGLDKSGKRFLWTVRKPAGADDSMTLDTLLPEGFLESTKDRGVIVESWAPQVEVLRHPSTGAFVTHCGWNSTLEAITYGVPMLCWPLYAEQKLNKVFITDGMGVGMEMEGYREGFIKAEEVEAKVKLMMESEVGRELRAQVVALKKDAQEALEDGGSSQAAFVQFLKDVNNLAEQEKLGI
ncbi:hypothetical protein EJB05_44676, partial [Eragrostis curvula]